MVPWCLSAAACTSWAYGVTDLYLLALWLGCAQERPQATAAVVQDLVSAFPKPPDCVRDVKGPLLEIQRVSTTP